MVTLQPVVSIITPAYNAADTLADTLDSVRSQSFTDWELILIDDHSMDDTVQIAQGYNDPRIVIVTNPGKGVSSARNHGLDTARGRYITFLDADDIYYSGALEKRIAALEDNPTWQVVYCETEMVDENLNKLGWILGKQPEVTFKHMSGNPLPINSIMGRAEVFKSRRFSGDYANGEDWLFHSRILRTGMVWHKVEGTLVNYRLHHRSTVGANIFKHEESLRKILDIMYSVDPDCADAAPEYKNGITEPPYEEIYICRRAGLLVRLMLEDDRDHVLQVARDLAGYTWDSVNLFRLEGTIMHVVARYYLSPVSNWMTNLQKDAARLEPHLLAIKPIIPEFVKAFNRPLEGKSIAVAPKGWRDLAPNWLRMNPVFRMATSAPRWILRKLNI